MAGVKRKLIRNTIANYAITGWQLGLSLFLFSFILGKIGLVAFGIWSLVNAITGYTGLLDLGVTPSLVKHVAQYKATEDKEKINQTVNTAFFFFLWIGIIAMLCLIVVALFLTPYFKMDPEYYSTARYIFYLTALTLLFGFPMRAIFGVWGGLQRYDIDAKIGFAASLVQLVTIITVLSDWGLGGDLIDLIFWEYIATIPTTILSAYLLKKHVPYLDLHPRYSAHEIRKDILKFGSSVFALGIIGTIIFQTDRVVIGAFLSVGAITYYAVASKFHTGVHKVFGLAGSAVMPATSELSALKKKKQLRDLVLKSTKYTAGLILSLTIPLIIMTRPIIQYWLGEEYTVMTLGAQVFMGCWVIMVARGITTNILMGLDKLKPLLLIGSFNAIANFVISIILVIYLGRISILLGVLGVILGTVIPYLILTPIFLWLTLKITEISWKEYFKESLLRTYSIMILPIIGLWGLLHIHYPSNLIETGFYLIFGFIIYAVPYYFVALDKNERSTFLPRIGL